MESKSSYVTLKNPALYHFISRAASIIVIIIGCLVLGGWALNFAAIQTVLPGLPKMVPNTAISFVLAGISLWLHSTAFGPALRNNRWSRVAQVLAALVVLIGVLTLGEYLLGWGLGIDQLLFTDPTGAQITSIPGRPSPQTALAFTLAGISLLIIKLNTRRRHWFIQYLIFTAVFIVLLTLVGYGFSISFLYRISLYTGMALHTAVALLLLCAGILFLYPYQGFMALMMGHNLGGIMARRLLLAAIIVPLLVGWLSIIGERVELYSTDFQPVLLAVLSVYAYSVVIWWYTNSLSQIDVARKEAEERLRQVVEASPNAIILVSPAGQISLVNEQAEILFGYERKELLGQSVEILVPPQFRTHHHSYRDSFFSSPTARPMGAGRDLFGVRKDGSQVPVEIGLSPIIATEGNFVLASVIDITERKRAEEALAQFAEELRRSNTELEQFAYVASHDLQEPLRMVTSYLQLLERRYTDKLDDDGREFIHYAVDGANRMSQLIKDLLAYSRVGTHGNPFEPTDCEAVLKQVLHNLELTIADNQAEITCQPLPTVLADNNQLIQLFQNLIGNALKYRSEVSPKVAIDAKLQGDEWLFSVSDNGIGIEPEYAEQIFVIFHRLHNRDEYSGTGIGLATCKKITERHGGRIWVESQPGEGSTFYFTLPGMTEKEIND